MAVLIGFDDDPSGRGALELGLSIAERRHEPATVVTAYPDDERGLMVTINDSSWLREVRATAEREPAAAKQFVGDRAGATYVAIGPASASPALHEYAERTAPAALVGSSGRAAHRPGPVRQHRGAPGRCALPDRRGSSRLQPARRADQDHRRGVRRVPGGAEGPGARPADRPTGWAHHADRRGQRFRGRCPAEPTGGGGSPAGERAEGDREVIIASNVVDTPADLPGGHPDLLVCGSRGHGPVRQAQLGSVSARLVRDAACPVIVVPRTD